MDQAALKTLNKRATKERNFKEDFDFVFFVNLFDFDFDCQLCSLHLEREARGRSQPRLKVGSDSQTLHPPPGASLDAMQNMKTKHEASILHVFDEAEQAPHHAFLSTLLHSYSPTKICLQHVDNHKQHLSAITPTLFCNNPSQHCISTKLLSISATLLNTFSLTTNSQTVVYTSDHDASQYLAKLLQLPYLNTFHSPILRCSWNSEENRPQHFETVPTTPATCNTKPQANSSAKKWTTNTTNHSVSDLNVFLLGEAVFVSQKIKT